MRRLPMAVALSLAVLTAGCGLELPDQISLPSELTGGEPQTLDAATKSAQEVADRRTSGDFAGVWLMLTKQQRNGINQADYVALQNACAKTGLPARVTGVRLDNFTTAVVRWNLDVPGLSGIKVTKTMLYEDGKWALAPDPDFVWDYGQPVQQIIANRQASGDCDKSAVSTPSAPVPTQIPTRPSVPSLTSSPYSLPAAASTSEVNAPRTEQMAHLAAVRLAARDGNDRLVLEFTDLVPGYQIGYRSLPMQEDASGADIPLSGATAAVRINLMSATASGWAATGQTYFGPSTVTGDTTIITEARAAGDFEAVLTWVVGLRSEVPFRVSVLDGPPRLVIDFQH